MKKMQRIFALFLCALTILPLLAGCAKSVESGDAPQEPTVSESEPAAPSEAPTPSQAPSEAPPSSVESEPSGAPDESPTPEPSASEPGMPSVFDLSQEDKDGLICSQSLGATPYAFTWLLYQNPKTPYEITKIRVVDVTVEGISAAIGQATCNEETNGNWYETELNHELDIYGEFCNPKKATNIFTVENTPENIQKAKERVEEGKCDFNMSDWDNSIMTASCVSTVKISCRITLAGYSGELPYTFSNVRWHCCYGFAGDPISLDSYR